MIDELRALADKWANKSNSAWAVNIARNQDAEELRALIARAEVTERLTDAAIDELRERFPAVYSGINNARLRMIAEHVGGRAEAAEPVAWRMAEADGDISYTEDPAWFAKYPDNWTPLYTHPAPTADAEDAARWQWFVRHCVRTMSLDMGGRHSYAVTGVFGRLTGPTLAAAIDEARRIK